MDLLRFNYSTLLKRSKSLSYREQITTITIVLMNFLKENNLVIIEPYSSDLTEDGNLLFKEYYPKWSRYIDRGGDVNNTKILDDGLDIIKNR